MDDSIKVLLVEHRHAVPRMTRQLLAAYELEFSWQRAASERELSRLAAAFAPDVVLCADDFPTGSNHTIVDALRVLSIGPPIILVCSLGEEGDEPLAESASRDLMSALKRRASRCAPGPTPGRVQLSW